MDLTERIRRHFDELAEGEWERLDATPRARASFEVHRRLLEEFVGPGTRVLEIGAGPGRFTIAMAEMGAGITVTDISPVQLELNRSHVSEAGQEEAVEARFLLDVRDTERFADERFDVVVAYGGPLSYVFEDAGEAMSGLMRIGHVVVASVMSTLGSWRFFLPQVVAQTAVIGRHANDFIIQTGDLRYEGRDEGHTCQMYRYREVAQLVDEAGGRIVAASASNWASLGDDSALETLSADPEEWDNFLDHEVHACREPGVLDAGTHILFAAQKAG